ncbi:hypothetical protein L228DRAFT_282003 [Xylona heveae TC161]|uniref:Spindle pole body component n=1 Tax=Xylona heveae (strain CBS 132557 / TC161) TaxID=1328760 RepID=A0A165HBR1_XYLHT|nr:hypothetical protein L228DRAFT_282003 [Xylona heveae TC161]KZF23265.1 hypothetical protein L228DRAFT_282003 [Xylona heveae TC161]
MLHEILLALSGHPSPLLPPPASKFDPAAISQTFPLLSPPERALLSSLAWLSELHRRVRDHTSSISSSHPSTICRAVSTAIASKHLDRFQQKIVDVERQMLRKDGGSPNEYEIMPLSLIVTEFEEWIRRMEWLWDLVYFMMPVENVVADQKRGLKSTNGQCSGAAIIEKLRKEARTGFPDIHDAATDLSRAAETAWLRQLSSWLLYGRLPKFGGEDFFIQEETPNEADSKGTPIFTISERLRPQFVTPATASSILFIGRSLNHIRIKSHSSGSTISGNSSSPELVLLPAHLSYLSSLSSPLTASSLSRVIANIRFSLSQNALQHLLPVPKTLEILRLLREFFLLGRGEFAVTLITEADEQLNSRHRQSSRIRQAKGGDNLKGVLVRDGEVNATLARTWAALSSYAPYDDEVDDKLELARDLVHLTLPKQSPVASGGAHRRNEDDKASKLQTHTRFNDLLFSSPVDLTLIIPSPLDLFLSDTDLQTYSEINAYLLSIRRAHHHLTSLWKHSTLRRSHPQPPTLLYSNTRKDAEGNQRQRQRESKRAREMRKIWATCSATVFLLSEIESYFQGEVVEGSWEALRSWVENPPSTPNTAISTTTTSSPKSSKTPILPPVTGSNISRTPVPSMPVPPTKHASSSSSTNNNELNDSDTTNPHQPSTRPHDPESLSRAHRVFLSTLKSSLLLDDGPFAAHMRSTLAHVDHLVALVTRLQTVQQNLDLEADEAVIVDALANHAAEERTLLVELEGARERVERASRRLVGRLREYDAQEHTGRADHADEHIATGDGELGADTGIGGTVSGSITGDEDYFEPFAGAGVDRLLMKLDFGSLMAENDVLGPDHVGFD